MSDLKCWMCNGLGAVKAGPRPWKYTTWIAFRPKPQGNIRLDRDEHVCPACHGSDNPPSEFEQQIREREQQQRQVEVTLDRPAGRVAVPPGEGPAPAYDNSAGASGPPASRT